MSFPLRSSWKGIAVFFATAFVVTFFGCRIVLHQLTSYTWTRAHWSLLELHRLILVSDKRPTESEVNEFIRRAWDEKHQNAENPTTDDYLKSDIAGILDSLRHRTWGAPPIYREDNQLPDGFGFYIQGEDLTSLTKGEDEDDINTWDKRGGQFYSKKAWKRRLLRYLGYSLVGATLLTLPLLVFRSR